MPGSWFPRQDVHVNDGTFPTPSAIRVKDTDGVAWAGTYDADTGVLELEAHVDVSGHTTNPVRAAFGVALPANAAASNALIATGLGALPAADGVDLEVGDRVLVSFEVTETDRDERNGLYVVSDLGDEASSWSLVRADDADESDEFEAGMRVPVLEGGAYGGAVFELATTDPVVVGTTYLVFVPESNIVRAVDAFDTLRALGGSEGEVRDIGIEGVGPFIRRTGGSFTDDGGRVLCVAGYGTSASEAWLSLRAGTINPVEYEADATGVNDSTLAFRRALRADAALGDAGGRDLCLPFGSTFRVKLDIDGTTGTALGNVTIRGSGRSRPGVSTIPTSRLLAITNAQNGGVEPDFVVRAAGQNVVFEDICFDGDKRAAKVVHFDYQSFGSGLYRSVVVGALQYAPVTITPDNSTDTFQATGHGFVDGDQITIKTTATLPTELYQPAEHAQGGDIAKGCYSWVWFVVNSTADTFQVALTDGGAVWPFGDNGSGTSTATKYGGTLVQVGGVSGLQADTGTIRDTMICQDLADFSNLAGRGIFFSDENAVLWDVHKCHIQGAVDAIYVRGGACSVRETTIFPSPGTPWARSHFLKDGYTGTVAITDETYTEVANVAWITCLNPAAFEYAQPWILDGCYFNVAGAHIRWDCMQPLVLKGSLGGNVYVAPEALGNQYVTALGCAFTFNGAQDYDFRGNVERVIKLGVTKYGSGVENSVRRLSGPDADSIDATGEHGFGLFLDGGAPNNATVRKWGPIVFDLGNGDSLTGYENQSAQTIHAYRDPTSHTFTADASTDKLTISTHGLTENDSIRVSSSATLPAPLFAHTDYWVIPVDASTFKLAKTRNGTAIDLTSAGTGTLTAEFTKAFRVVCWDVANFTAPTARDDVVGPAYFSSAGLTLDVVDLDLKDGYLHQFDDTVRTFGSVDFAVVDSSAHTGAILTPGTDTAFGIVYCLEVQKSDGTTALVTLSAAFKRISGTVTQVGTTVSAFDQRDVSAAAWLLGLGTDGTNVLLTWTLENNVTVRGQGELRSLAAVA